MLRIRNEILAALAAAILLVITVFALYVHGHAGSIGSNVGALNGKIVGTAIGSFKGITEGAQEGEKAGESAGLSAEDTTADIKAAVDSIGRLEVLSAGVTLKNMNRIGDSYSGLYLINADAVFTVDLAKCEVSFSKDGSDVYVWLPAPELDLYMDQSSTKMLAEKQKFSLSVKAKDGLIAYLNSMTKTVEEVKESLSNYDSLMEMARDCAKNQVMQLAGNICGDGTRVHVEIR